MEEKILVRKLKNIFLERGFLVKREVGTGYGIADLVLVRLDARKCAARKKNNQFQKLEKEEYFEVLNFLPNIEDKKPVSLEFLTKKTSLSKSFLKYKILRTLEKGNYIKEVKKDFYFKINGWIPIAKEIIAIEAKLKNWKRGIIQANRYKSFSNKVYLAIPFEISHLVDKNLLKRLNIGLIVLDIKRNYEKISHVKREEPLSHYKYNLAAELVLNKKSLLQY